MLMEEEKEDQKNLKDHDHSDYFSNLIIIKKPQINFTPKLVILLNILINYCVLNSVREEI